MTNKKEAPLAQLVEHLTLNQGVQGSNPWRRIKYRFWRHMSSGVGAFFVLRIESGASEQHEESEKNKLT